MTDAPNSFFRDRGEVVTGGPATPGQRRDPLGVSETLDTLREAARMEAIMLITDASVLLDELGQRATVTFDENAARILLDDGSDPSEPGVIREETIDTTEKAGKPLRIVDVDYYLRPARFAPNPATGEPSEFGDDVFFLLDETPSFTDIQVRNPFLIKAEVGDNPGEIPGIEIRGDLGELLNDKEAISTLRAKLDEIIELEDDRAEEIRRRIAREEEQARLDEEDRLRRQEAEIARLNAPQPSRRRIAAKATVDFVGRNASRVGIAAAKVAATGLAIGVVFWVGREAVEELNDFDCKDGCDVGIYYTENNGPRLPEEAIAIPIGESGSPTPLFEVTQDELYSPLAVPEVGDQQDRDESTFGPNADGGLVKTEPANIDFLVQVVLDEPGKTDDLDGDGELDAMCEATYVDFATPEDKVRAAVASTEEFRQDEFVVYVMDDQVKVCWLGEELRPDDNPSVFLNRIGEPIVPLSERDIRPPELINE